MQGNLFFKKGANSGMRMKFWRKHVYGIKIAVVHTFLYIVHLFLNISLK